MSPAMDIEDMPFWSEYHRRSQSPAVDGPPDSGPCSALHLMKKVPLDSDKNLNNLVSDLYEDYYVREGPMAKMRPDHQTDRPTSPVQTELNLFATHEETYPGVWIEVTVSIDIQIGLHIGEALPNEPEPTNHEVASPTRVGPSSTADALLFLQYVVLHSNCVYDRVKDLLRKMGDLNEANVVRLQDLKEALVNYNYALDQCIQRYVFMEEGHFKLKDEDLEKILKYKEDMLEIIKSLCPDDLHKLIPSMNHMSTEHILCSILGVNSECAEWLVAMPCRSHQNLKYWFQRYVEDKASLRAEEIEERPECDLECCMEDELVAYGFTRARARIIQSHIKGLQEVPGKHTSQSLLYWSILYLNQKFEYDILLNNAPRYPYNPDVRQEWSHIEISTEDRLWDQDEDDDCDDGTQSVDIINLNGYKDTSFQSKNGVAFPPVSDNEHVVFFHATDHKSAKSIIEQGILPCKGQNAQDFSGATKAGFYLSPDVNFVLNHAKHSRFCPQGAVLVYKVPRRKFETFRNLDLCGDKETWDSVIRFNRTEGKVKLAKDLKKEYNKADYVEGPICTTHPKYCSRSFRPAGFGREEVKQTCLLSESIAAYVGDIRHIDGVMFFNEPL